MVEPTPRTSRLAIAAGLTAMVAIGGGGFLLGRSTVPPPPPPVLPPRPAPTPSAEAPPPVEEVLRRSDLIALGAAAADAAASGTELTATATAAVGKRFELIVPFGCDGSAPADSQLPMRWRYDADAQALRIHVAAARWPVAQWWQEPPAGLEAMEGFWIGRPWSSSETCPAASAVSAAPDATPVTLPGQTLGIVQLIRADTPRQMRRDDKPYEAVVRMTENVVAPGRGLHLRLTGRVDRFPDGRPVRCREAGGREQRPICLIAVSLEEVAFQNPGDGALLATWQPTADTPASGRPRE